MTLPVVNTPTYTLKLPSDKKQYTYRPYLVKEEKILLIAEETGNEFSKIDAIKQVVANCTFGKIDANKLPSFDVEYMFIQLRAKSVGEVQTVNVRIDDPKAKEKYAPVEVNLSEIEVQFNEKNDPKIPVTDTVGLVMKYPTMQVTQNLIMRSQNEPEKKSSDVENLFEVIALCVDYIYDAENIYHSADIPREELLEWIENLSDEAFNKIRVFLDTLPTIRKEVEFNYETKDGEIKKGKQVLEGLNDFFT